MGTKNIVLMWRMTKMLWVIGKTVIMNSIFYVFRILIGMFEKDIYGI